MKKDLIEELNKKNWTYPQFLMEINKRGVEVAVSCDYCDKEVVFPPHQYLGNDWCGCDRRVMYKHGNSPLTIITRCPDVESVEFFGFMTWWEGYLPHGRRN